MVIALLSSFGAVNVVVIIPLQIIWEWVKRYIEEDNK